MTDAFFLFFDNVTTACHFQEFNVLKVQARTGIFQNRSGHFTNESEVRANAH